MTAGAVLLSGGRTRAVRAIALGALGVTVLAVVLQGMAPSDAVRAAREVATRDPARVQDCERHGSTTYCAFPEFTPGSTTGPGSPTGCERWPAHRTRSGH